MFYLPSDGELEILRIIWALQPVTVRTIHERIALHKPVGYTTVLKQVQRMYEEKGVLNREVSYGVHRYSCPLSEREIKQQLTEKFLQTVFPDSVQEMFEFIGTAGSPVVRNAAPPTLDMADLRALMQHRAGI